MSALYLVVFGITTLKYYSPPVVRKKITWNLSHKAVLRLNRMAHKEYLATWLVQSKALMRVSSKINIRYVRVNAKARGNN